MDELQELLATFSKEVAEYLDTLGAVIESLSDCPQSELADNIQTILRTAHTIKGGSACVGEEGLAETAHQLEDVLSPYRGLDKRPPQGVQDNLLELLDVLRHQAGKIGQGSDSGAKAVTQDATTLVSSLRVDTERLDDLMKRANDLSIFHVSMKAHQRRWKDFSNALDQLLDSPHMDLEALYDQRDTLKDLLSAERVEVEKLGYLTSEINDSMKRIRMQPLRRLLPFWRRTVQQSAQYLQRRVSFSVEAGEIEIDRYLVEHLQDSMLHLLRNAVDHGIEAEQERTAAGKAAKGRIDVRAKQNGGMIHIDISDDGRGIDAEKIASRAIDLGLLDEKRAKDMDTAAKCELLFDPAFSTSQEVSQISGRGVGLNVVRKNVERLGGRVEIDSQPRLGGSTFHLELPMSLLSTVGLLVRAGAVVYAIATDDIEQVVILQRQQIQRQRNKMVAKLEDGTALPLVWLTALMGRPPTDLPEELYTIILSYGSQSLALVVDGLLGGQEYLTEHLPWNLERVPGVNGTVVLADGSVALSVDTASLFTLLSEGDSLLKPLSPGEPLPRILVVDDSLTSRVLERNFLAAAGYRVALAEDGQAAWTLLQKEAFDLVVSDVQMPQLDGLELTRRIRASERLRKLPVVLVTQLGGPQDIARGQEVGANEYLIKGRFDQKRLLETVSRFL